MKTSVEEKSGLLRKITFEIPPDKVTSSFDRVYRDLQKNANIKGFRKGKAPLQTIKSLYGDSVKKDVLQDLFYEAYSKAIQEHKLQPVTQPAVQFDNLVENDTFKFTAEFEVYPEVKINKYEKLSLEREKLCIRDDQVLKVLDGYRQQMAEPMPIFEDRPAQKGDIAVIDFVGKMDGVVFEGGSAQNYSIELGSQSFIEGFEDGLVGMAVGSSKTLNLKLPENYKADLANKEVSFDVTLKALQKKVLPELNDEFAKKIAGNTTLEELKKNIREEIEASEKKRIQNKLRSQVISQLVQENPVTVPVQLLNEEKQALIEDTQKDMKQRGMNESQFEEYKSKWDKDFTEVAQMKIQANFLIMALSEKLNMKATKEDIDNRIREYAQQLRMDENRVRKFYTSRNGGLSRLEYQIIEEKVVEHLIGLADIKDVEPTKES